MGQRFNPEILTIARGSRGKSQADLALALNWSQGKASKVEHGMLQLSDDDVASVARELRYPVELFFQQDSVRGFGSCCQYHRKRATTPIKAINQLHDTVNIRRMQISRMLGSVTLPHEPNFPPLDIDEFDYPEQAAQALRAAWNLPRGPIDNLADAVEAAGGIVVLMDLNTPKIDAVSQRAPGLPPVFFLNRDIPADRCRWTLAHEIGHIVMHATPSPNAEEEADRFASEFLMPKREIAADLRRMTIPRAAALKQKWRVSMQALIRRAKDVGASSPSEYQSMCVRISQLGYRKQEPNPINAERPQILRMVIDIYLRDRGYSVNGLSAVALSTEDEFREVYLADQTQPQLRIVADSKADERREDIRRMQERRR